MKLMELLKRKEPVEVDSCSECGTHITKLHKHHDDYAKPKETRLLCVPCHQAWHRQYGKGLNYHLSRQYFDPDEHLDVKGEYMNSKQTAAYLEVSPASLCRWRQREGYGPPFLKLGKRTIRYKISAVEEWMQSIKHKPTQSHDVW